jgi:chromosome segregation ATPase
VTRCAYCKRPLETPETPEGTWRETMERVYQALQARVDQGEIERRDGEARQQAHLGDLEAGLLHRLEQVSDRLGELEAASRRGLDALAQRVSVLVGEGRESAQAQEGLTRRLDRTDSDRRANEARFGLITEGLREIQARFEAMGEALTQGVEQAADAVEALTRGLDALAERVRALETARPVPKPPRPRRPRRPKAAEAEPTPEAAA